ncbi:hypothetical protein P280DRAFT_523345 [Massarina eburnea CBS 473.64]|uniref:Uncharacterized protein n=1 Tax=Massarina eburnea CBS 473.64 TaxID=1395130 RepID=A0A6A6RJB8_9PLEO|nr:hypothetical protein P280DRAFT_523345 [Massarina eburnea CBS 473.64]
MEPPGRMRTCVNSSVLIGTKATIFNWPMIDYPLIVPGGLLRFAIFIPFGVYSSIASGHWNVIKAHQLLQSGGPYNPAIAAGERFAASWGKFGFWWTFAAWLPTILTPVPFNFIFGIIDAVVAIQISLATHAQTGYSPHRVSQCIWPGAHELQRPPGSNESFFDAAARLNATTTDSFKMCKTFAHEFQYGVAVSFFYSSIAFLNLMFCFLRTLYLWRDARKTNNPFWPTVLLDFSTIPKFFAYLLATFLYFIPAILFRCLPISVKSRVRMVRRSSIKAGQIIEEKSGMQLKIIKTKIEDKVHKGGKESGVYVSKGDGVPTNLSEFLSIYDMLILVTQNLHYTDINNLGIVSKSVREAMLPADAYAQRMVHFKMYTCRSDKTQCWVCDTQVCKYCQSPRGLKQTTTYFHLDSCQPYCTPCYFSIVQKPPGITLPQRCTATSNQNFMDPRHCDCAPVTKRWWYGPTHYARHQNIPYILRHVCRECNVLTDEELLEKRQRRTKWELRKGWRHGAKKEDWVLV